MIPPTHDFLHFPGYQIVRCQLQPDNASSGIIAGTCAGASGIATQVGPATCHNNRQRRLGELHQGQRRLGPELFRSDFADRRRRREREDERKRI